MAWLTKHEWIDLARARHVVIFHNPDTGQEHHLINEFALSACPHCGQSKVTDAGERIDFQRVKIDTLKALNEHHKTLMQYREKHPNIRLGNGPK